MERCNTYIRANKGKLFFTPKDDRDLTDLGYFDKSRRKIQERKKMNTDVVGAVMEQKCPGQCKLAECHSAKVDYELTNGETEDISQSISDEDIIYEHFSSVGAVLRHRVKSNDTDSCKLRCFSKGDNCDNCMDKALKRETKLFSILKKIVNGLNLKKLNVPMYSWYKPLITEQIVKKDFYEKMMSDESINIYKLVRLLSWGIIKMTPEVKEEEVFIPVYEAFHQVVLASQAISVIDEKDCAKRKMNVIKAHGVVLNSLRKTGSDESGRLLPIIEDQRF